ncbi:MAG TPA: hypothetical protein VFF15_05340 [Flavobacteriaceae bacterium]|nr:hypothetical protein [Flavobacteriaceae bacterium]
MKNKLSHIKLIAVLALSVFMFGFSAKRNAERKIAEPTIVFIGKSEPFITAETVSKLLIQNQQAVTNKPKETLDLNKLEAALNSNSMIKSAQVFLHIDGALKVEIEQKKPIARVHAQESYYIDDQGFYMPLSNNHTARVPLVTGQVKKDKLTQVFRVADKVHKDNFLRTNVVQIHQNQDETLWLKLRNYDFIVELGSIKQLDKKINNLKAFYKKGLKDKVLHNYARVNLKFDNQVVCTKT